ncbi:mitofilin family membrane protein [Roseibium denhamense]|uniref:Inner membrane protein n=1 Tax=Roseibium denhamense TaxID=76305 RepID=A0ABY1P7M9_9HYPH|nr:mitofilin family membrane protein [Roseibium denhamense]SMP28432.1 inner membrane protein [Roseibium denhamense]
MIGGIIVLGGGFGLYQAGLIKLSPEQNQEVAQALSAAERKIAALETELGTVSSAVSNQDAANAVSALESKVTALEAQIADAGSDASSGLSAAVDSLKQEFDGLRSDMAAGGTGDGGGAPVDLQPLETRIAKLEDDSSTTSGAAEKLSGSLSGLESELASIKTTLSDMQNQLSNTEATAKAAQTAVSTSDVSLKTLADSQARATETLSSLSADIQSVGSANSAALEDIRAELKSLSDRLGQVEATMGDATAREVAARALSVSALKSAVDSGRPYETELAAVKAGLPSDIDLQALEAHAKTGVEPVSVLIAQFPAVARQVYQTFSEPDRSGDVLDSFLASARSLVAVRGPGDADGTGPEAVLRRMENAVSSGKLQEAITAYDSLPESAQAAASDWVTRARARVAVDTLTDQASQEVLTALSAKDS